MDEKDLYNKIIQAANIINNCNRSIGDYIVVGSKTANHLNELMEEIEYKEKIEALRKLRKQKLEKIKEIRNNSNPY